MSGGLYQAIESPRAMRFYRLCRALLWCGLNLLASGALAADKVLDATWLEQGSVAVTGYFAVLEDPGLSLTLADVREPANAARFRPAAPAAQVLTLGFTPSAYWLRVSVRNAGEFAIERMLDLGTRPSSVQFHQPTAGGAYRSVETGMAMPFATRPYANRFIVFPLTLPAHSESVYYLRLQSTNSLIVPTRLWTPQAFHAHERSDYVVQAWYFGMAAAMILFNLLLFVALRDRVYLYYVSFATCMALTLASQAGLAQEFLWPEATQWSNIATFVGYALVLATLLIFMRRMLDTGKVMPRFDRLLGALVGVLLVFPALFFVSPQPVMKASAPLFGAVALVIVGVSVLRALKGQRSAYFFVAAYFLLTIGGMLIALRSLGLVPTNEVTVNGIQAGSALEMLLLAFALADRINTIRREKAQAQQEALLAQQRLVETLRVGEHVLEQRVEQRTAELYASNTRLELTLRELMAAQGELIESEKQAILGRQTAVEALEKQRRFVSMASHEFRSPLAVIDAGSQLLALVANKKSAPVVGRIRRGVRRLAVFLDNCLTEERLDSERLSLRRAAVELDLLAGAAKESTRIMSDRHQTSLELDPDLPLLDADPDLLRVMLFNLLDNAVKYSPQGGEIRLSIRRVGEAIVFEVADRGMGIPADEIPFVFEKYRRGRGVASIAGAGLGLSLVARIVALHGAGVQITSVEGQGTRVVVTFETGAAGTTAAPAPTAAPDPTCHAQTTLEQSTPS